MTTQASKHDIQANDCIYSDSDTLPFAVFANPKKDGQWFAKIYKRDGAWMLISDEKYDGGGLIAFLNNYSPDEKVRVEEYIEITKVLPNVVMAIIVK